MNMNHLTSRAILCNNSDQILIVRDQNSDYWGLPGGGIESSETPLEGLMREIKEEVSLNRSPSSFELIGVEYRKEEHSSEVIFVFNGGVLSEKEIINILPANEIGEAKFMHLTEAYKLLTPGMVRRLSAIFSHGLKKAVYLENGQEL